MTLLETVSAAHGGPRSAHRRTQLGRVAQRRQPLDGAARMEGRALRQPGPLLLRSRRPRRHRHRARRWGQRADRPELRTSAAAGRAGGPRRLRRAQPAIASPVVPASATPRRRTPHRASSRCTADGAGRSFPLGRMCCWECDRAGSADRSPCQLLKASTSSASQAPATPTPAPSTNQRSTGVRRHPHTVGASPPAATRLSPTASSGCTWTSPRLSTTIAAPMTAATNPATVRPIAQGSAGAARAASAVHEPSLARS